jgi:hypothetical protein
MRNQYSKEQLIAIMKEQYRKNPKSTNKDFRR